MGSGSKLSDLSHAQWLVRRLLQSGVPAQVHTAAMVFDFPSLAHKSNCASQVTLTTLYLQERINIAKSASSALTSLSKQTEYAAKVVVPANSNVITNRMDVSTTVTFQGHLQCTFACFQNSFTSHRST